MNKPDKVISVTYMSGPFDGETLRFPQPEPGEEVVLQIGRREDCEIYLGYDNQVSRNHACLGCAALPVSSSDSVADPVVLTFWLEDSDSRNGTFVDRKPINQRINLRPGTLFKIGRTWLRLDFPLSYAGFEDTFSDDMDEL